MFKRLDRLLGFRDAATLNWKGRTIERSVRSIHLLKRLPGRLDARLGLTHDARLNWKGRTIDRGLIVWKRLFSRQALAHRADRLARWLFHIVNEACFHAYRLAHRSHPDVRSVLQLSIVSHKPFMLSRLMRQQGIKSDFFALNTNIGKGILNMGWDYQLPAGIGWRKRKMLECFYLWTVLARYDVIHSHFKTFLSDDGWELEYLRRLGKVLVFHFRGCDIRYRSRNMQLQPELNCCQECDYPVGSCDTPYQRQQIDITRKYGDLFFVTTPDLLDFMEGSEHHRFIPPIGIDVDAITAAPRTPGTFRVVTSSNHHGIDGTRFIRDAVARLQAEGRSIELVEVNQMQYRDALAVYKSADVYVGKLRMGYYNNANIETMQLGVPNMSYIRDDFRSIAPDCPIIVTTPDTVYERLSYYIDRPDELRAIGARGPAFVNSEHSPQAIAQRMIARYNDVWRANRKEPA